MPHGVQTIYLFMVCIYIYMYFIYPWHIYHFNSVSRKIHKDILYIYVQHVVWNWCFCFVFVDGTMVQKQMLPHEAHVTHELLICADKWIRKILVVIIWEESASCKEWSERILLQSCHRNDQGLLILGMIAVARKHPLRRLRMVLKIGHGDNEGLTWFQEVLL